MLDRETGQVATVSASVVVLATGGAGKVYLYTTNPDVATGDGVAMAYRAGAAVANLEFFQFHPTCLFHPQAKSFLVSEACRGEGGILRNGAGERFMTRYDPRKELAPRDVVARSIDAEMKRPRRRLRLLDMTHLSRELPPRALPPHLRHLPGVRHRHGRPARPGGPCRALPLRGGGRPTSPAALPSRSLYAVGEVSCTGLHGANRLASNSLLEGLVFGRRAAPRPPPSSALGRPVGRDPRLEPGRRPGPGGGRGGDA